MTALRMPSELARDLVSYCVRRVSPGLESDALLHTITAVVCEVRVRELHVYETAGRRVRYARVVVAEADADRFLAVFPEATPLKAPSPGLAAFRVTGRYPSRLCQAGGRA